MKEAKQVSDLSIVELKAYVYDASKQMQVLQNEIKICEHEIDARIKKEAEEKLIAASKEP